MPLAGSAVVLMVSVFAGFVAWDSAAVRPTYGLLAATDPQRPVAGGDSTGTRADFSEFAELQQAMMQSEAEAAKRLSFLKSLAEQLQPGDFQQVAQSTVTWPRQEREGFLVALARRWATVNAPAACAFFFTLEDAELRVLTAGAVMEKWALQSPGKALQWLKDQPESVWRTELSKQFSNILEATDPRHAIVALDLLPEAQRDQARRRQLAVQLAAKDPRAAVAALKAGKPFGPAEHETLARIAEQWLKVDFPGALAYLKLPDKQQEFPIAGALLTAWGEVNPQAALQGTTQPDGKRSPWTTASILSGWARKDPAAARAYATALPLGSERELVMNHLIYELGTMRKDLGTLIELHRESTPMRDDQLLSHFPELVREGVFNYTTIAEGIRLLPEDEHNRKLLGGLLVIWSEKSPEEAAAYLGSHASAAENPFAVAAVAKAFAAVDPDRAIQWAMKLPGGEARDDAITGALQRLASTDAERAWSLSEVHLPVALQRKIAAGVADGLARRDVTAAMTWADGLTDQASRAEALRTIAGTWARSDAAACAVWLGTLASGEVRDRAIEGFAPNAVNQNPETALQWAAAISDEHRRQRVLAEFADKWHSLYPQAAQSWIDSTDLLSPSMKQWLLSTKYGEW